MKRKQEHLEQKFTSYVSVLEKELKRKEENNHDLAQEVEQIKL